ncbi:MAG: hypothetical protein ACRCZ0_10510 [Cetobacterium sp.]
MTSKNNNSSNQDFKRLEDNGPKWGSYVKQNADQSFPYDSKMASERPSEWLKMITERTSWLNRDSKYDYTTGKIYPRSVPKKKQNPIPFDSSPFTNYSLNFNKSSNPSSSGSNSNPSSSGSNSNPSSSSSGSFNSSKSSNSKYANNSKK